MPDTAVLLINSGTPEAPTPAAVRRFLSQFLADPRIVDLPRWLWLPILHLAVLPRRPQRVARHYAEIWGADGSPLRAISQRQARALQTQLGAGTAVRCAFLYGPPQLEQVGEELYAAGCRRFIVVGLFPQLCTATSCAVCDRVARLAERLPEADITQLGAYAQHESYLDALAAGLEDFWRTQGRGDHLLLSFHGIPEHRARTESYAEQCRASAEALVARFDAPPPWTLCFQSRYGMAPWLRPYTEKLLTELPQRGVGRVDVCCPGFSADCLETLHELGVVGQQQWRKAGGEVLRLVPCLNDTPQHIELLARLVDDAISSTSSSGGDFCGDCPRTATA